MRDWKEQALAPLVGLLALFWIGVRTFTRPIPKALDFVALVTLLVVLWIHWDNSRSLSRLHRPRDEDPPT